MRSVTVIQNMAVTKLITDIPTRKIITIPTIPLMKAEEGSEKRSSNKYDLIFVTCTNTP